MTNIRITSLSDSNLLAEAARVAAVERHATANLIALLAEIDLRKLYLGQGYSSLFCYCTQSLHLSESAAYARITAARATRSFPSLLPLLRVGAVTLTTVNLLAAHLTEENAERLLTAASHKSRREVERLVASLVAQPDVASSVRRLPDRSAAAISINPTPLLVGAATPVMASTAPAAAIRDAECGSRSNRTLVAPLGADRYLVRVTLSGPGHEKLERARALLRHQIPSGDPALVVERALTVLVEQLERRRHASTAKPRSSSVCQPSPSRHVPAAVKRAVWARDGGRCAFVGAEGRCSEVSFVEFHHVLPFAAGGLTNAINLELRCRAHNAYEATLFEQSSGAAVRDGPGLV